MERKGKKKILTVVTILDRNSSQKQSSIILSDASGSVLQMFQRLCIHVIQRLRPVHAHLYLQPGMEDGYVAPDWSDVT